MDKKKLYVITPVSNPVRFASRYKLYNEFAARMNAAGVNLYTVELAFGDRTFEVTKPYVQNNIQLRTSDEMWHKENMLNVAISRLPSDWEYVAWVDADVNFVRADWAEETVHQLQHFQVVQMWQNAIDMGPTGEALSKFHSFMWCYSQGMEYNNPTSGEYPPPYGKKDGIYWHPGFAWAARREAVDALGGLLDRAILGAGDHHMALALIGKADVSVPGNMDKAYTNYIMDWQSHAERFVRRDVGYVPGTIMHSWHGKKRDRHYQDRWKILQRAQYDPMRDIKRDWQGVYQLVDDGTQRSIQLRNDLRGYFRSRNEDSVDLE